MSTLTSADELRLMPRPQLISFDATGTLFSCPRLTQIYAEVLGRHGVDLDPGDIGATFREVFEELDCRLTLGEDRFSAHPDGSRGFWTELILRLCERVGAPEPSRFACAELYDRFRYADAWDVYEEVVPTLESLRAAGIRLAVLSNWDERLPTVIDRLGLSELFETVVYSQEVGFAKPSPMIFKSLLEQLGADPSSATHIGDRAFEDVEGALASGCQPIWLNRSVGRRPPKTPILTLTSLLPLAHAWGAPVLSRS